MAAALSNIQQQLAELAETHETDAVEGKSLAQLKEDVAQWEEGSNTAAQSAAGGGGKQIVAIEAPGGVLLGSQAGVAIGAQTNVDLVSVRNTQVSAGRKLMLHALQGISLFAHALGVKLIAASGKVEIAAQDANIEITSAKRIVLAASEEIVFQAPSVTIVAQGAQVAIGDGAIAHECTGSFIVKSVKTEFSGMGDGGSFSMRTPESVIEHTQRVRLVDLTTGEPLVAQRYRVTMEDGQIIEGVTGVDGMTKDFKSEVPFGSYFIEAISN